ncbi:MAG: DUF3052 domain-containing protein [Phycisphaeraceae bacterium]|nr:DUF3052 domain-containing protein [Phycisphaeraceae bacterium]MCB9848822.1 DUF3052 domain-containing protein [Phycisphaeraceae bacterium]
MAGYSGTPLPKKLGIKPGHRIALLKQATEAPLDDLDDDVEIHTALRGSRPFDLIMLLTDSAGEMERTAENLPKRLTTAGMLWLGWPKKASGVPTDLSDARVREIGLALGLVDNKTCAIDDVWSGLRFVRRLKDR